MRSAITAYMCTGTMISYGKRLELLLRQKRYSTTRDIGADSRHLSRVTPRDTLGLSGAGVEEGGTMLVGPGGKAAYAAAASILAVEGGLLALLLGAGCYLLVCLVQLLWDVARAHTLLRGRVPVIPWRPKLLFKVYTKTKYSLLDRVSGRMAKVEKEAAGDGAHPHRAFGAVIGTCPFVHIGGAGLARAALAGQPVKAPLYHAFKAFAGEGIFTAEGKDWADKRVEVLASFATVGLEPLAAAAIHSARHLTEGLDRFLMRAEMGAAGAGLEGDGAGTVVEMLPRLQRATLRSTFEYLTGASIEEAVASTDPARFSPANPAAAAAAAAAPGYVMDTAAVAAAVAVWEDEYLKAATALRHLIPARARSVWMASDLLYGLSPVGRLEARSITAARRLPLLALQAARPGSPLALLAQGAAHGGGGGGGGGGSGGIARGLWNMCTTGVVWGGGGVRGGSSGGGEKRGGGGSGFGSMNPPPKGLLDEAVTLLFAGHDTQSATLSWALLRLAGDRAAQADLRLGLAPIVRHVVRCHATQNEISKRVG